MSPRDQQQHPGEIAVEIPVEEVNRETNALIQKYQKLARIPGFRRGHVPASVIRQRFSEDLKSDVVEALVPRYFRKEADRQGLIPVSQPQVTDLHLKDNEPLRFKASFEVMPEIKVEGYKELRAEKTEVTVTDEEVEQSLNGVREQHATFTAVEGRSLADGDYAQVSLDGKPKDGEDKPVHMDEVLVNRRQEHHAEFTENLRGAWPRRTASEVIADAQDRAWWKRRLTHSVKVTSQKSLPELDDQPPRSWESSRPG